MNTARRHLLLSLSLVGVASFLPAQVAARDAAKPNWSEVQQQGCAYLLGHQKGGIFSVKTQRGEFPDPGFTSLAIAALQSKPTALRSQDEQKVIDAGLAWVLTTQNGDGSFGRNVPNYTTCAAVLALGRWQQKSKELTAALQKAQKFLLMIQSCERTGSTPSDIDYGGIGYGARGERADLSNMQFAIAALRQTGLETGDEAFARALVFLQRTQNLPSANDLGDELKVASKEGEPAPFRVGDDGGAVYYPGESPAGVIDHPDGTRTPRSYGSMTYALLKTYTLCGVKADDPRVQAAVGWIREHWTVEENPGADPSLGEKARYQGLFYSYMLLAQALDEVGIDRFETEGPGGKTRNIDWRSELKAQLAELQRPDGSWLNERNGRWYEGLDLLCTCYALLALEHCE